MGRRAGQSLPQQLALARVRRGRRTGYLTDAFALPEFAADVLGLIADNGEVASSKGRIVFRKTEAFDRAAIPQEAPVRFLSAEQSNSSLIYGDQAILKLFRRITPGIHPEAEMSRALTERGFANTATLLGEIVHEPDGGAPQVLAVLQAYVAGEGDAWTFTLSFLQRATDGWGTRTSARTTFWPLSRLRRAARFASGRNASAARRRQHGRALQPVLRGARISRSGARASGRASRRPSPGCRRGSTPSPTRTARKRRASSTGAPASLPRSNG